MNDINNNEVKKVSPYKGIEDPAIRAQYEKEYGMINVRLLVSIILVVVCASAYVLIISDTFSSVKKDNTNNEIVEVKEDTKDTNADVIDPSSLVVIDETKPSAGNFVCDASYKIENLDYEISSMKVPYINFNTEDAIKVNNEIKDNYKIWASESSKYKKKYQDTKLNSQSVIKVKYEIYNFENILSVVICFTNRVAGMETNEYYSYSFNTTKESILASTNEELKAMIDNEKNEDNAIAVSNDNNYGKLLSYQEILAKLNLSFELVDTHYKEILNFYSNENNDSSCVDKTLNLYNKEVNDNTLYSFIDTKGNLNLISKIYTPIYEMGTYRIFKFDGEKFEAASFGKEENKQVEKDLLGVKNIN